MATLAQPPIWLQGGVYPARIDRQLVQAVATEGVVAPNLASTSLKVTERGAGANNSCDVAAGFAIVQGDNISYQGRYLVVNEVVVNVTFGAAPGVGTRIDGLYLQVNDPTSGGGAGDNAVLDVVLGPGGATLPTLPASAIFLAYVTRTAGDVSITNSMITDARTLARVGQAAEDGDSILASQVFS